MAHVSPTRAKRKEFDNTNRGALFRNDRKEEDSHPDYRGNLNVDGTEYWVSAWLKTSKEGTKYMSLSVKPKVEPSSGKPDLNDDIPF